MTSQPEPQPARIPVQISAGVVENTRPALIALTISTQGGQYTFVTDLESAQQLGGILNQVMAKVAPAARAAGVGLILPTGVAPPQNGHARP